MSRKSFTNPVAAISKASDDVCPVCKSNRYLNKDLKFLINPECYHKMCSSCVDRLFTSGPAPCPIVGCHRTLRKKNFKEAFFADLTIQRSVDIRRKVQSVFNRKEDDFVSLRDWNEYLQMVEDLTFDLTDGSDKEKAAAEEKLRQYSQGHKGEIEENRRENERMRDVEKERERKELADLRERRLKAVRMEEEEKQDLEKSKRDVLEKLANTDGDANAITKEAQRVILKKSSARRSAMTSSAAESRNGDKPNARGGVAARSITDDMGGGFAIRGLKAKAAPVVHSPYDPFGGIELKPTMFVLQDDYDYEWLNEARRNESHAAGGYSLQEYYSRTMFEAFSGLGVFVEDEVKQREEAAAKKVTVSAPVKMDLDDVF